MNDLARQLRAHGLKATPQRLAIYELLAATDRHPTAESIYENVHRRYPTLSLNTVYLTLRALEEARLILRLSPSSEASARYDARVGPHAHAICTQCGEVEDLEDGIVPILENLRRAAQAVSSFAIEREDVSFYGLCSRCRAQGAELADESAVGLSS